MNAKTNFCFNAYPCYIISLPIYEEIDMHDLLICKVLGSLSPPRIGIGGLFNCNANKAGKMTYHVQLIWLCHFFFIDNVIEKRGGSQRPHFLPFSPISIFQGLLIQLPSWSTWENMVENFQCLLALAQVCYNGAPLLHFLPQVLPNLSLQALHFCLLAKG